MADCIIEVKRLNDWARLPWRATAGAAGWDIAASERVEISPKAWCRVPTGLAMAIPEGFEVQLRPRSGLAARHGITLLNSPGTIDADYRGEIQVILINHGESSFVVEVGMRIAQALVGRVVVAEYREVEVLGATTRGAGGFGHTGSFADGDAQ